MPIQTRRSTQAIASSMTRPTPNRTICGAAQGDMLPPAAE